MLKLTPIMLFHPYFICCVQLLLLALFVVLDVDAERLTVGMYPAFAEEMASLALSTESFPLCISGRTVSAV